MKTAEDGNFDISRLCNCNCVMNHDELRHHVRHELRENVTPSRLRHAMKTPSRARHAMAHGARNCQ